MAAIIYSLCALTCFACAVLLLRSYRTTRFRLQFWSGLCFLGLTASNVLLVLDRVVFPTSVDLSTWRLGTALVAVALLLVGLIWEGD
jgi:uncharacterized protein DUF5985